MHDYYYRGSDEEELIIQAAGSTKISIRATEENDNSSALVLLPIEEIDRMISGLQKAKQKIINYKASIK